MNTPFADLDKLATHLRQELQTKKFLLLYAYNGTGKTRLSMAFKEAGQQSNQRDTLVTVYFPFRPRLRYLC